MFDSQLLSGILGIMVTLANVRVQSVAIYISRILHKKNSQIPRQLLTLNYSQALSFYITQEKLCTLALGPSLFTGLGQHTKLAPLSSYNLKFDAKNLLVASLEKIELLLSTTHNCQIYGLTYLIGLIPDILT